MELRHLRYFLAIAEHSHFRAAADELLVSQPTLSQQMKDLEKELGCALFERVGRGVRLTEAGSLFSQYARQAMNVLAEGQSAIEEFDALLRGRLRVGVVQTVGAYLIPSVVAKFSSDFPGIDIRVEERSASEIEVGLVEGSLDLAVSFEPTGRNELSFDKLFDEQMVLIATQKHPLASRKRLRVSDLENEPLCLLSRDYCTRRMIDAAFNEAEATTSVAIEMTSVEGCLGIVEAGGPPTILPQLATTRRQLHSVRIERPIIRRTIGLLRRKTKTVIRASEEFALAVHRSVSDDAFPLRK